MTLLVEGAGRWGGGQDCLRSPALQTLGFLNSQAKNNSPLYTEQYTLQ